MFYQPMANATAKHYGVTEPLSLERSSDLENEYSSAMDRYLYELGFFETDEAELQREKVLGKLDFLVKRFVAKVGEDLGVAPGFEGKIFTFGSYRLGVHSKGADIDVLCVAPRHITRKNFFGDFFAMLSAEEGIRGLTKVEDAYVPLIKFEFDGIPIDLVFASIHAPSIKNGVNLLDNTILKGMDEKCILSVNGNRVTDEILNLVPDTKTFHSALRCIKYWAKRRAIYGHTYGYFGGVSYTLCVARVCQLYPNASSFTIVQKFFKLFMQWKWPNPVILKKFDQCDLNFRVWDPATNMADKFHKMPVITPAYPSMCSTHNVFSSTQYFFTKELTRAHKITTKVVDINLCLKELFSLSDFFITYKNFIAVFCVSHALEGFETWEGFVESKIRILCGKLEEAETVTYAIPYPRSFAYQRPPCKYGLDAYRKCTAYFIALDFTNVKLMVNNRKVMVNTQVDDFNDFVQQSPVKSKEMEISIKSLKKAEVGELLRLYTDQKRAGETCKAGESGQRPPITVFN